MYKGEVTYRSDIPARTDRNNKKAPTKQNKQVLYGRQNGQCAECITKRAIQHLEIDHIIPQADGGWHDTGNLQLLCGNCNRIKGDRPMEYLRARLKVLYNSEYIRPMFDRLGQGTSD